MTHFWQNSDCSEVDAAGYWPLRGDRSIRSGTPRNRPTPGRVASFDAWDSQPLFFATAGCRGK